MIRDVILNSGTMYELWQKLINKEKHSECIRFFAHKKGMRVLDIGCGPGNNAFRFLDTEYYGFDLSEDYIQQAESRWKGYDNIHFVCADVNDYFKHGLEENNKYDLIIMHGVLHHLTDEEVKHCVSAAKNVLKSDGEFRTLDGIYLMGGGVQHKIAKWFLDMDRGKYVRTEEGYSNLIKPYFSNFTLIISSDMLRIPYHQIMFYMKH